MKKIALIGYGNIAQKHIEVFRSLDCEIIASCNRTKKGNILAQSKGNIKKTYLDYYKMIDDLNLDGIIITTSFQNIYSVAKDLIPYKLPILLEKPSGTSLIEHNSLVELSKKYKTPVQLALNRRHYSNVIKLLSNLDGFKNIKAVNVEWSERPFHLLKKGMILSDVPLVIFGNTIHGIDLMKQFTGDIDINNFDIITKRFQQPLGWYTSFKGISEMEVYFNFSSSWNNPVPWRISIYSNDKTYVLAPLERCVMIEEIGKPEIELDLEWYDQKFKPGFYNQTKDFINLMNGGDNKCSLESATNSMEIAQKLYNSIIFNEN